MPEKDGKIDFRLKVIKVAETKTAAIAVFGRMEGVFLYIVNHKHIVGFHETFEYGNLICTVIEYCDGGDIENFRKKRGKLSEAEIKDITAMSLFALHQIH